MVPDDDTVDWLFDASARWLDTFGVADFLGSTELVTPTEDDFPVDLSLDGEDLAEDYFAFVLEHARLTEWPLELEADETPRVAEILRGMPHHLTEAPRSTDHRAPPSDGRLVIPYSLSQLEDPVALVATMARGVSHYHILASENVPPHDDDERELLVDVGAVFLGFGVFLANAAFRFEQHESGAMVGWGFSRQGALSELDLSYTLAIFSSLLEIPERDVRPHLKPNPRGFFTSAMRHLQKTRARDLDALRSIGVTTTAPYR